MRGRWQHAGLAAGDTFMSLITTWGWTQLGLKHYVVFNYIKETDFFFHLKMPCSHPDIKILALNVILEQKNQSTERFKGTGDPHTAPPTITLLVHEQCSDRVSWELQASLRFEQLWVLELTGKQLHFYFLH